MSTLPARPDIDQLRHQAKDLLRAARAGDTAAAGRIAAVSDQLTLTAARLAIARQYGFASWVALKAEVQAYTTDMAEQVGAFLQASVRDGTGRAARMLQARPEIAEYGFATAVVLGDAARVRDAIDRDPALATRPDARWGWSPLLAVCGSRWHRLDPARAGGLLAVARMLLDAGADPTARQRDGWTPLRCAVAGAANPALVALLLDRGAVHDDHDLYLACFGGDDHESLRLLLDRAPNVAETTALAAPISTDDIEGVRLLLAAGADPNRPLPADLYGGEYADDALWPAVHAAVRFGCSTQLVQLLLDHGADPNAPGPDGRSPHELAVRQGAAELARLVRRHSARAGATEVDLLLAACLRADRPAAERQLSRGRVRLDELTDADRATICRAAELGRTAAVHLMLDLGFPVEARGDDGGTPLHAAAYSGSAGTVRVLLDRGADMEARDNRWDSPPLVWAMVGSGERPKDNADADWVATVQALLEAGASIDGIALSPDDPKPPSSDVAQLLRAHGVPDEHPERKR
jgi:ankyrin repeat protein